MGKCDAPDRTKKKILIPLKDNSCVGLETSVHEAIHAAFYLIDEETVECAGHDIATFLWRLGWRRVANRRTGYDKKA
jgi:hypothetical protein